MGSADFVIPSHGTLHRPQCRNDSSTPSIKSVLGMTLSTIAGGHFLSRHRTALFRYVSLTIQLVSTGKRPLPHLLLQVRPAKPAAPQAQCTSERSGNFSTGRPMRSADGTSPPDGKIGDREPFARR